MSTVRDLENRIFDQMEIIKNLRGKLKESNSLLVRAKNKLVSCQAYDLAAEIRDHLKK